MAKRGVNEKKLLSVDYSKQTINFVSKPNKKVNLSVLMSLIIILGLICGGGYLHFSWMNDIDQMEADLKEIKDFNQSKSIQDMYMDALRKEGLHKQIMLQYDAMATLDMSYMNTHQVDKGLLDLVVNQMPKGVFLTRSKISNGEMVIDGYSQSYDAVGQFAFNLNESYVFNQAMVRSVDEEDGNYKFIIQASWIRGENNEAE